MFCMFNVCGRNVVEYKAENYEKQFIVKFRQSL